MLYSPLTTHPARHDHSDLVAVEWEQEGEENGQRLLVAPFHIHLEDDEIFYVLSGQLQFLIDGVEQQASAGDCVMIPHGSLHTWWNASPEPCRYLIVMPKRVDTLIAKLHSGAVTPDNVGQTYADHAAVYFGWNEPTPEQLAAAR